MNGLTGPTNSLSGTLALRAISDDQLLTDLDRLRTRERQLVVDVLVRLSEVERRRLHLAQGYRSMFDYCVRRLRYSESSANRRIRAARLIKRHPDAVPMIAAGDLSVAAASMLAGVIDDSNKDDILTRARGKSQRAVEALVAEWRPEEQQVRDRVGVVRAGRAERAPHAPELARTVHPKGYVHPKGFVQPIDGADPVGRADPDGPQSMKTTTPTGPHEGWQENHRHSGGKELATNVDSSPLFTKTMAQTSETEFRFVFGAGAQFKAKFDRARALLSNRSAGRMGFARVFEFAIDALLEHECPQRQAQRAVSRKRRSAVKPVASDRQPNRPTMPVSSHERGRRIPAATRRLVHVRDGGKCTFVGSGGVRCGSTHRIHVDHIVPFALGGGHSADNLRLLCAAHNQLEAARMFGARTHNGVGSDVQERGGK